MSLPVEKLPAVTLKTISGPQLRAWKWSAIRCRYPVRDANIGISELAACNGLVIKSQPMRLSFIKCRTILRLRSIVQRTYCWRLGQRPARSFAMRRLDFAFDCLFRRTAVISSTTSKASCMRLYLCLESAPTARSDDHRYPLSGPNSVHFYREEWRVEGYPTPAVASRCRRGALKARCPARLNV